MNSVFTMKGKGIWHSWKKGSILALCLLSALGLFIVAKYFKNSEIAAEKNSNQFEEGSSSLNQKSKLSSLPDSTRVISSGNSNLLASELDVLPPWTPVEVSQEKNLITIKCWGREYVFNENILPSQISSQGVEMLASPMAVNLVANNEELELEQSSIEVVTANDAIVELEGRAVANNSGGRIDISSKIQIEYDGLMVVDLTIRAPTDWTPNSLGVDIPYRKETARYYMRRPLNRQDKYSGEIPVKSGLIESKYTPHYWIGNNDKGVFWFCESAKNWPNFNSKNAIQIIRSDNKVTQKINLVAQNAIPEEFTFEFGLQATPVKPMHEEKREWRIWPAVNSNIVIPWPNLKIEKSVKYYGFPEAKNPTLFKARVKSYQSKGLKVLPYSCITQVSTDIPGYIENKENWRLGANLSNKNTVARAKGREFRRIHPESENYVEFITQKNQEFLRAYDLDGYYLDISSVVGWRGPSKEMTYPILAYRNLYREYYTSIKEANPSARIIVHMSRNINPTLLAYADAYVSGEQFRYLEKGELKYMVKSSYMDHISLSQFRAEFIGRQFGLIPFFLPEIAPEDRKKVLPTRGLAALLLLHDVQPWPTASNIEVWNAMYRELDEFGFTQSEFIPYYSDKPPGETGMKGVYISVYKRNDGRALVVVANLSKQEQNGVVSLASDVIGWPIEKITKWPQQKDNISGSNQFNVTIPGLSYEFYLIER